MNPPLTHIITVISDCSSLVCDTLPSWDLTVSLGDSQAQPDSSTWEKPLQVLSSARTGLAKGLTHTLISSLRTSGCMSTCEAPANALKSSASGRTHHPLTSFLSSSGWGNKQPRLPPAFQIYFMWWKVILMLLYAVNNVLVSRRGDCVYPQVLRSSGYGGGIAKAFICC